MFVFYSCSSGIKTNLARAGTDGERESSHIKHASVNIASVGILQSYIPASTLGALKERPQSELACAVT